MTAACWPRSLERDAPLLEGDRNGKDATKRAGDIGTECGGCSSDGMVPEQYTASQITQSDPSGNQFWSERPAVQGLRTYVPDGRYPVKRSS